MGEDSDSKANLDRSVSIVVVPEQHLKQVMQYVSDITSEETDVTGYMLASTFRVGSAPVLNAGSSGSGCKFVDSGKKGFDWDCFDTDSA